MNLSMNVSMVKKKKTNKIRFFDFVLHCLYYRIGICKVFEEHLKKQNPSLPSITYDISELFQFIDQITDLSCLVTKTNRTIQAAQ